MSAAGIEARHAQSCPGRNGGRCRRLRGCGYRAWVWSASEGRKIRQTFPTLDAAKSWRADAAGNVRRGRLRADGGQTLREAAEAWLAGARSGAIRTRSGDAYKPSALRGYKQALTLRVLPELGGAKLSEIERADIQRFIARIAEGRNASTVRNTLLPLRAIFRHALAHGDVSHNPTTGLQLPAVRGRRIEIVSREQAAALIEALPKPDRALWATAFYAGLRSGELQALRWRDVDLAAGVIRVERSWDRNAYVAPKSRAGRRAVPIPETLRRHLEAHRAAPDALAFGKANGQPFSNQAVSQRATRLWTAAGLEPVGLHAARHTFASMMIAAGANVKALSTYLGHANIAITMDTYGHLMPGSEAEAAGLLDAYLAA